MKTRVIFSIVLALAGVGLAGSSLAQEKVKFATSVRALPIYDLPMFAAEEKALWRQNDLEGEWISFRGAGESTRALAAGAVYLVWESAPASVQLAARGAPVLIIADSGAVQDFYLWVRGDSPFQKAADLRKVKIGINRFGGMAHAYGRFMVKALGLEKEVKLVAEGGIVEGVAAMRSGAIDGRMSTFVTMIPLKFKGEARDILSVRDYLPKPWMDTVILARKDFLAKSPEVVKRTVTTTLAAASFVLKNREWTIQKLKSFYGYSDEIAKVIYDSLEYSKDGRIERRAVENVRNFLIDYEIVPKDKTPPADELFTTRFTE